MVILDGVTKAYTTDAMGLDDARARDRIEGGVRDEAEDLVVDDHPLLAADLGPLHDLRVLRGQVTA